VSDSTVHIPLYLPVYLEGLSSLGLKGMVEVDGVRERLRDVLERDGMKEVERRGCQPKMEAGASPKRMSSIFGK